MKSIVVIGSGNVAEALSVAFAKAEGYDLVQVFGRNRDRVREISAAAGCGYATLPKELEKADIYIISVSDRAIFEVAGKLDFRDAVVAHTAGSVGIDEFPANVKNCGAFYPLQTFTAGRKVDIGRVPVFVEGNNAHTAKILLELGQAISGNVYECDSRQRMKLHLAAVFACNFTNHLYAVAETLLDSENIPHDVVKPLIEETAAKAIAATCAAAVQTGPAARNDTGTMQKHEKLLKNDEKLLEIYKLISGDIWGTSKKISQK